MFRAIAVARLSVAVLLLAPLAARAAEHEAVVAASLSAGALVGDGGGAAGGGGIDLWIGLDDWVWVDLGAHGGASEVGSAWASAGVGLAAALDVLAWVPWIEGRVAILTDARPELRPALELGLGVDRLIGEQWWLGAFGRLTLSSEEGAEVLGSARGGALVVGGIRLALRWDL